MPLKSAAQFAQLSSSLGGVIIEQASKFAAERQLPPMRAAGLDQMSTKIDEFAAELLMFGHDTWPESAGPEEEVTHEAGPSDVDPPRSLLAASLITLGAVVVSVPATMFLTSLLSFPLPGIFYVLTALALALIFGSTHGLVVAVCNAIAHNVVIESPTLTFTPPTEAEIYVFACSVILVLVTPWIARHAAEWRDRFGMIAPISGIAKERNRYIA